MKKKMFFTICLVVFILLPVIALAAPAPDQETKQLKSQYAEAWKKVEGGIDFKAFSALKLELSLATQRYKDKYPNEQITEDFAYLNQLYADIEEIWQLAEQRVQFLPKTNEQGRERGTSKYFIQTLMLKMKYPSVLNASLESKEYGYFVNSVLENLFIYTSKVTENTVKDK